MVVVVVVRGVTSKFWLIVEFRVLAGLLAVVLVGGDLKIYLSAISIGDIVQSVWIL